jgi:hypothetical protein
MGRIGLVAESSCVKRNFLVSWGISAEGEVSEYAQAIDNCKDSKAVTKASRTEITILTTAFLHDRALPIY